MVELADWSAVCPVDGSAHVVQFRGTEYAFLCLIMEMVISPIIQS